MLKQDEKQIHDDHDRWSRYFDNFVSMGEDQSRKLKATAAAKERSEGRLNQAKRTGEQAMQKIARSILAAGAGKRVSNVESDNMSMRMDKILRNQSDDIAVLRRDIADLRLSVVDTKSDHHHLNEIADVQRRQEQELSDLWKELQHKPINSDTKLDKRIADLSTQVKTLTAFTSKQDEFKQDLSELQARKIESIRSEFYSLFKSLKESIDYDIRTSEATSATFSRLEVELAASKQALAAMEASSADRHEINATNALIKNLQHDVVSNQQAIQRLDGARNSSSEREDLQPLMQTICESSQQILGSYTNDRQQLRNDQQALTLRCNSIEHLLEKFTQGQLSSNNATDTQVDTSKSLHLGEVERRLETLSDSVARLKAVEDERDDAVGTTIDEFNNVLIKQTDQFKSQNSEIADLKNQLSRYSMDQSSNLASIGQIKTDTATLNKDINAVVERRLETLSDSVARLTAAEDERDDAVDITMDKFNNVLIKQTDQFKSQKSELADLKSQLGRYSVDQSSNSASIGQIKTDIVALNEDVNAVKAERNAQRPFFDQVQSNLSLLQRQVHSPPQASPTPPIKDDVQPKIEALESRWRDAVDKVRAIETFQATYESRWNNLTTEHMVKSVLFHTQQMYPLTTLNALQVEFGQAKQRQDQLQQTQDQLKQTLDQHRSHMVQLTDLVNRKRNEDVGRVNELEKVTKNTVEALSNIRFVTERFENHLAQSDKSMRDMESRLEQMNPSDEPSVRAQNSAAIKATKEDVVALKEKFCAMTSYKEPLSELKNAIHDLQTSMNGKLLGQDVLIKAQEESIEEVYQECIKEITTLNVKVDRYVAQEGTGHEVQPSQEIKETQNDLGEIGNEKIAIEIDEPRDEGTNDDIQPSQPIKKTRDIFDLPGSDDSDDDPPVKGRGKRHASQTSMDPGSKKRKKSHHPHGSDEDASAEPIHISNSPQSARKPLRGSSQQPDTPSSQPRRGRPRKHPD